MTIHSWDIFDTIIGRKCGTPKRLWGLAGQLLNVDGFADMRVAAERVVQSGWRPYTIHDIYRQFATHNGFTPEQADDFCQLELQLEQGQAFPIAQYANQVSDGDIFVSDMYLSEPQIRAILDSAGIRSDIPIYVSCHGKTRGTIWDGLVAKHGQIHHVGDNRQSDYMEPRKHHIRTSLAVTGWNSHESFYATYSESLAWWVRYHRLRTVRTDTGGKLAEFQIQFNLPMLLAFIHELREFVADKQADNAVFLSRDGYLSEQLWRRLYPEVKSKYLYCSRECMRNHTGSYVDYASRYIASTSVVIDLAASFRSYALLQPHIAAKPHLYTMFFIPSGDRTVRQLPVAYLLDQKTTAVNNTYMEMLNYATHWHVADVDRDGNPVFDQPNEYDMSLVEGYHAVFKELLEDVPTEPFDGRREIAAYAAKQIHSNESFFRKTFPGHIALERTRNIPVATRPASRRNRVVPANFTPVIIQPDPSPVININDTRPVIVGAADNLRWPSFETWALSIALSQFTGHVFMLTYRLDDKSIRRLHTHKITPFPSQIERHVVVDRFRDLAVLSESIPPDTWIVMLDVTDLVLQTNPTDWLSGVAPEHDIVVGSECIRMCDQWWVSKNLKDTFPEHYDAISPHLLYNAGSFAARAAVMRELATDVWEMCCTKPYTKPNDQDAFNVLLHSDKYRDRTHFADQREGWCANIAATVIEPADKGAKYATEPLATIDKKGVCRVENGVVPAFLHHYTRSPHWKRLVEQRINAGQRIVP